MTSIIDNNIYAHVYISLHFCSPFSELLFIFAISVPIQTLFEPHPDGVQSINLSHDSKYLVTASYSVPQVGHLCISLATNPFAI